MDIKVLYEDNHLIAVYKPSGVLVMAGGVDERRRGNTERSSAKVHDDNTLYWQVKQFIIQRDKKPGDTFLGVLHRLDRPVSGIVLFAKTSKGASRLSEQIRERQITKIYHALVIGKVELKEATLMDSIRKDSSSLKAIIGGPDPDLVRQLADGDEAVLHYQVVAQNEKYSLLKIQLETGRFHQIRAQLAAIGHPIVGDVKYASPAEASAKAGGAGHLVDHSIALCATELKFMGATDLEEHDIQIDYPKDWDQLVS